jgi:S-phase kinase-associated protein 1
MMTDEHFIDELNECKETEDIPVMRVSSHLLGIIVKFMHYYADDPMVTIEKPIVSDNLCDVVQKWYATFILQLDEEVLYDLVNASNYMHIQPLLELSCAAVAVQRYC